MERPHFFTGTVLCAPAILANPETATPCMVSRSQMSKDSLERPKRKSQLYQLLTFDVICYHLLESFSLHLWFFWKILSVCMECTICQLLDMIILRNCDLCYSRAVKEKCKCGWRQGVINLSCIILSDIFREDSITHRTLISSSWIWESLCS